MLRPLFWFELNRRRAFINGRGYAGGASGHAGFVRFYIPMWVRRIVTMLPSFIVILAGMDATQILVMSQVLLSFGIALALVPLLVFTGNKELMGELVDTKTTQILGKLVVLIVVGLNAYLLISLL